MDVEKLYHASLQIEHVARLVRDTFETAKLEVETNDLELGLYLAVTRSRKEIEELGLGETEQKRLKSHGPSPGITTAEILQRRRTNRMKDEDGEESCREEEDDESQQHSQRANSPRL